MKPNKDAVQLAFEAYIMSVDGYVVEPQDYSHGGLSAHFETWKAAREITPKMIERAADRIRPMLVTHQPDHNLGITATDIVVACLRVALGGDDE